MRTLVNLKLWVAIVLLVGGMSSCMDSEDSLNIYVQFPYTLQNDNGTFTPQVRLYGYDLQSAYLDMAGKRFNFSARNEIAWEIKSDLYAEQLDSIPYGYYTITAMNTTGKTGTLSIGFPESNKKIGEINLSTFEYDADNKKIQIELADSVQNASLYYLMVKQPILSNGGTTSNYSMWIPYSTKNLTLTGDRKLSAEVELTEIVEGKYYFALGAAYNATIKISDYIIVEIPATPSN